MPIYKNSWHAILDNHIMAFINYLLFSTTIVIP